MKGLVKKPLRIVFWAAFLFTNHIAFTTYINSSYLSEGCGCGIPENVVGLLFTTGSVLTIVALAEMPKILKRFGNRKTLLTLLGLNALALVGLIVFKLPYLVGPLFAVYLTLNTLIAFSIDIFIQHYTDTENTGDTRGIYLTVASSAWILAPFITGFLVVRNGGFQAIYIIGLISVLLVFAVFATHFKHFHDPNYTKASFMQTIYRFWQDTDLRKIFVSSFILQFFYATMVIYSPIYLSQHIGLPWNEIGIIFAIMLTPFVLFEIPLGILADRKYGEKEILTIGYIIMAAAVFVFATLDTTTWWVWAIVLFFTRTGASAVQVMVESYFFKHVKESDVNFIGVFRDSAPLAYLIAPLFATVLLSVFGLTFETLFIVLGIICISGILYSTRLHDTK
jgi:MFS family permease